MSKENLNLDNTWNALEEKFPRSMNSFCRFIDKYKKENNWDLLFNSDSEYQNSDGFNAAAPKFHDIPFEMQTGIIVLFFSQHLLLTKDEYFVSTGGLAHFKLWLIFQFEKLEPLLF